MKAQFLRRIKGMQTIPGNHREGTLGLVVNTSFILTEFQLLSIQKFIKNLKYKLSYKVLVHTNIIKTKKSLNSRMGAGKGNLDKKVIKIKKGSLLFLIRKKRIKSTTIEELKKILRIISFKLPVSTYIIEN